MNNLKCMILDDEQHSIDILTAYIQQTPGLELIICEKDPLKAIPLLKSNPIDIAFIDVQMPNLTGLQFLTLLPKNTKVILCTAYSQYAVDGFELNVLDYLLKPIRFERFLRSIQKMENFDSQSSLAKKITESEAEYIFIKAESKGKFVKVNIKEILFIEGLGNYQKIIVAGNPIICLLKMKSLEEQLSPYGFLRVHKSFLVPIQKIDQIEGNKILIENHHIPIGDSYKELLFKDIKDKILL